MFYKTQIHIHFLDVCIALVFALLHDKMLFYALFTVLKHFKPSIRPHSALTNETEILTAELELYGRVKQKFTITTHSNSTKVFPFYSHHFNLHLTLI